MNEAESTPDAVDIKAARAHETGAKTLFVSSRDWGNLTKFPVSLSKLESLEKLKISRATIEDLTLISGMKSLKELTLELCTLQDLSPIANLKNLKVLNLDYSKVANTSSLSELTQIMSLSWVEGNLENTDPLQHLTDLVQIDLKRSKVTNLNGLSALAKLENLNLSDTAVDELSPLMGSSELREIDLNHTSVSDLAPLAGHTKLEKLFFSGTGVKNLKPLAKLTSLIHLQLYGTQINDLSGIEGLHNLITLNLNYTEVESLSKLLALTKLRGLGLKGTKIGDLQGIEGANQLRKLHLSGSSVNDISAVKQLSSLDYIDLSNTQVVDITPLAELRWLEKINLSDSMVDDVEALSQLHMLRSLNLNNTPVLDLRPVTDLRRLRTFSKDGGLQFEGTLAAKTDPEIARISANPKQRARATALYSQLEDWDLPLDYESHSKDAPISITEGFAFLSYAHQDRKLVGNIHSFLADHSVPLWWDSNLGPGDRWRSEISRKLSAAKVVVTFWTKESVNSKSVVEEASNAQRLGKLIHVRLDASPLPYGFAETQYLDLQNWDGTPNHHQMRKLLQSIRDKIYPLSTEEISEKLLASSPIALVPEEGKLTPKDTPPNVRPEIEYAVDLEERLIGLRQTVEAAVLKSNDTASYQVPNDLRHSLSAIDNALNSGRISWYGVEDAKEALAECMQAHGAVEAWNSVLVADLKRILRRLEELRPLLQPKQIPFGMHGSKPPELDPVILEDQLPTVIEMAGNLQQTLLDGDGEAVLNDAAQDLVSREINALKSIGDEPNLDRKLSISRRSLRWLAYSVGGTIAALSTPIMVNLLTAPEAAATLIVRLKPIYEFLLKFFS
ncbi:MAG TPA: TIR domain-containing protein [Roseobacter sp.]|uniref:TIR domain-containing protein n=1 Tax=marine sediment metagenome TaxID=412755 RepID=A0A0F9RXF0_9ZZZZ|nr:TIR domain-containing protein [Roseobacter sp.]